MLGCVIAVELGLETKEQEMRLALRRQELEGLGMCHMMRAVEFRYSV